MVSNLRKNFLCIAWHYKPTVEMNSVDSVNSELKTFFWIFLTFILDVDEDLYQVIGTKVGTLRFKCSVCSHKSRYKQGIIDHVKQVHRKERPYACTTCERSFFRKTDLRIHIRSVGLLSLLLGVKILYIIG